MVGLTTDAQEYHHDHSPATTTNENKAMHQLAQTIKAYTNLFSLAQIPISIIWSPRKSVVCETAKKDFSSRGR